MQRFMVASIVPANACAAQLLGMESICHDIWNNTHDPAAAPARLHACLHACTLRIATPPCCLEK